MYSLEEEKRRIKMRRQNSVNKGDFNFDGEKNEPKERRYVDNLIARLIIALIVFFGVIVVTNISGYAASFVDEKVLKDNMSFSKISNWYNQYFGNIVPLKNVGNDEQTVFNEKMTYQSIKNYQDGYELEVAKNYLVPVINSGIVVFIGEKEGLGNTVIIQGTDEVDYWYSNVENLSTNLYDYVSKGTYLGSAKDTKLFLTFKKGNDFLEYDEVVQ